MGKAGESVQKANAEVLSRIFESDPVLVDVQPAGDVVPGMTHNTILTSGAPLAWDEYTNGQRNAVIGGALFEGLASSADDAQEKIRSGEIQIGVCHDYGCIGSMAGIYTASMPVFVVENRALGNLAFSNFYEGPSNRRLNYGIYDDQVREALVAIEEIYAPVIRDAVQDAGGIRLRPLMARALRMGDELHSRNTAATVLFTRELFPYLLRQVRNFQDEIQQTLAYLTGSDYFFLRLSMAASKVTADAAHGVKASSVVSAMTISCIDYAIRVSGLGDTWFRSPIPMVEAKLFEGHTADEIGYLGGESHINETMGLGGFAQAAAFALQEYQGGSPEKMMEMNLAMYQITCGEHPEFKIPSLGFRGTPTGIDIFRVVESGCTPIIDAGVASKFGGQIGAGILRAPEECFQKAAAAHREAYGS